MRSFWRQSCSHRLRSYATARPKVMTRPTLMTSRVLPGSMRSNIESARSVPSIKVLCKVAAALKVSVAAFLRQHAVNGFEHLPADRSARVVTSNGRYWTRALHPDAEPSTAEFHELRIAPLHTEPGTRRAPGTTVNLVVSVGTIEVTVHDRRQLLATGDSIVFDADQPHSLRNPGDTEARAFRVTVNAETPPRWDVPHETSNDAQLAHAHSEG